MKSLILDLRGNPGGLLEEGVAVSDLFLNSGSEVVETRSRIADQNDTYFAERQPVDPDLPVIVLVDRFSASASEIVAGALQDHDRALVVGLPTFGKGSVQTLYPLPGGNYLKLTTAKWYTPNGRSIHREAEPGHVLALAMPESEEEALLTDTAEVFFTDGGRKVYGGGGITPDLVVRSDTLTSIEREFGKALGDQLAAYSDAVFRYAVSYVDKHPDFRPDFAVTPEMTDALYTWLQDRDVAIDRSLWKGARRLIERELGVQLATVAFDEAVALRRRLVLDRQLDTAAELLREAINQKQLFALAEIRGGDELTPVRPQ